MTPPPGSGVPDEPAAGADSDGASRAREAALELLSHRSRTVDEMRRRLRRKGFDDPLVDDVVRRLIDRGYLDDRAFAREFLRERLRRRPRGPFALVQELRERGLNPGLARSMVERVMDEEGVDEEELARSAAGRWLDRQPDDVRRLLAAGERDDETRTARRRLYGYLERRGFRRSTARRALDGIARELRSDAGAD